MRIKINGKIKNIHPTNRIVHNWQDWQVVENSCVTSVISLPGHLHSFSVGFKFTTSSDNYEIIEQD